MTILLTVLVDTALVLALGLVAVALLRKQSAALRHAILASTIGCALLMPLWEVLLPSVPVIRWAGTQMLSSGPAMTSAPFVSASIPVAAEVPARFSGWTIFGLVWAAGALVTCAGLVTGLVRLARLTARCAPASDSWRDLADELKTECGIRRHVVVLQSDDPSVLVVFGLLTSRIILPAGASAWDEDRRRIVLRHELGHIKRHDVSIQLAGEVLRALQWINPLAWMVCRQLRQQSEYACDDTVLGGGIEATEYATHLLDIARHLSASGATPASAPAIAHPSTLERRIVAMLHRQQNRTPLTRRGLILAALVALGISLPLAAAGVAPVDDPIVGSPSPDVTLAIEQPSQDPPPPPPPPPPGPPRRVDARSSASGPAATLAGTIVDQSGGTLPGVHVTLKEPQGAANLEAITNARGRFLFKNVPPGQYDLVASLPGFGLVTNRVKIKAGENVQGKLTLPLGTLQETITVRCGASIAALLDRLMPVLHAQDIPPPPPPPPLPIRVGGNVKAPTKVKDVRPSCPSMPAVDTLVRLTGRIGTDGRAYDVQPEPATASVPREFVDAALTAINQWVFTPTLLNGQAVEVRFKVQVTFTRQ